jgi:hypothetical protein
MHDNSEMKTKATARLMLSTINILSDVGNLQNTLAGANKLLEQSKHLSADAATLGMSINNIKALPEDTIWVLLRPVLRLCLWLLPEHVHASAPQAVQQGGSPTAEGSSGGTISVDWRPKFAVLFVTSVATVSVVGLLYAGLHTSQHLLDRHSTGRGLT